MTTKRLRRYLGLLTIFALLAMPVLSVNAAPGGIPGPPPSPQEETATNNLSVPAIFVADASEITAVSCPLTEVIPPSGGDPLSGYPDDPASYYYVQGVHSWQAECSTAASHTVDVVAEWGDNLTGAPLKANTPIRVEVGLIEATDITMGGYLVEKLDENALDRVAPYGTLATQAADLSWSATEQQFPLETMVKDEEGNDVLTTIGVRVYDEDATFSICPVGYTSPSECVVPPGTEMRAEINSTGRVVYGYNWGIGGHGVKSLPQAGTYDITFTAPNVTITASDPDLGVVSADQHTVTLQVTIAPKSKPGKGPKPQSELMPFAGDHLQIRDRDQLMDCDLHPNCPYQ